MTKIWLYRILGLLITAIIMAVGTHFRDNGEVFVSSLLLSGNLFLAYYYGRIEQKLTKKSMAAK